MRYVLWKNERRLLRPGRRPARGRGRKSPHLRASAVIAESAGHGSIPLRPDSAASFLQKINCHLFIEKPREFIRIYRILRKFLISGRSDRLRHDTRVLPFSRPRKCGKMRRPAPTGKRPCPLAGGVEKPPERVIIIPLKGKSHKATPPAPP